MTEVLNFITENQTLLIVAICALTYVINAVISYKAKKEPNSDWAKWQPTSEYVSQLVFQGAEWYGQYNKKSGDEKLDVYLKQLKAFEANYKKDKIEAVQRLLAWYLSQKDHISPNPITADSKALK